MISKSSKDWVRSLFAISSSKKEAERRLAQIGLGMVLGLQNAKISLAQAQEDLFNMKNYLALRNQNSNRRLLDFMEWGMELEDVVELAPQGLPESYERVMALARQVIRESLPNIKTANHGINGSQSSRRSRPDLAPHHRNRTPAKSKKL